MDSDSLVALSPQYSGGLGVDVTSDEHKLVSFIENLEDESKEWWDELGIRPRIQRAFDFLSANHFLAPSDANYRARVVINMYRSVIERKVGMLTDSVPIFDVQNKSGGLGNAAMMLKDASRGVWSERSGQQMLTRAIITAALAGHAPALCVWDPNLDYGRGDIRLDVLQPEQVKVDKYLTRASALQEDAHYVIIKRIRTLGEFRTMYGERGFKVKADPNLSSFHVGDDEDDVRGIWRRPSRARESRRNSAIPRAVETRCYFVDPTLVPGNEHYNGNPNYVFPLKRMMVKSGNTMLYDGHANNWDGKYPVEILDWGLETQHPFGESEIDQLESLQMAVNLLASGIVHNARLINQPPWVADEDALDDADLKDLRRYGDRPNWVHVKRPGSELRREPPGEMQPVVFQTLQMLTQAIETISGVTPVAQGQRPEGLNSGVALDSLLLSSQIPIRLEARAVEDFLSRLGQLLINRIIQYYDDDRLLWVTSTPMQEAEQVLWQRMQFLRSVVSTPTEEGMYDAFIRMFRDFRFTVQSGSALAVAKLQKLAVWERLHAKGLLEDLELLRVAEVPDPEMKLKRAQDEQIMKAMRMAMFQGGRPQSPGGGGKIVSQKDRQVHPVYQAGPGMGGRA